MSAQLDGRAGRGLITLDQVVTVEPGATATAIRNVPNTLTIFETHFPRFPVFPGVLILGSMAELAALLLEADSDASWRLAEADRVRYRHFVRPGDQLVITAELKERSEERGVCSVTARVDGKPVTTARALTLVPHKGPGGRQ